MKRVWICLFVAFLFYAPGFAFADLLTNPSFEASFGGGYVYNPTGLGWTFSTGSGVSTNGTAWGGAAEDGNQFAFLQTAAPSTISQSFTLTSTSDVNVSFYMALRAGYAPGQQIAVSVDGNTYQTFPASSTSWTQQTIDFGTLSAGSHMLMFAGTATYAQYGDTSAFLDNVSLGARPVPLPSAFLLFGPGLVGLAAIRRRFKK